jgi:glycosyltransferase involved in cell wall biosynthesis
VERILIALARHQEVSPWFEHSFALCFDGRLSRELAAAGAKVFRLPEFRLSRPLELLRARAGLAHLLKEERYDLAITHSAWGQFAFGTPVQRAGIANAFWLHTRAEKTSTLDRLAQLRFPDAVISVSRWVDRSAQSLFPGTPNFTVYSPLAIDCGAFEKANPAATRETLGVRNDQIVILQASRMEAWKGHRVLLNALKSMSDDERWVCWIAGGAERPEEEDYFADLRRLADALGIANRVRFLGRRDDVPALMMAADVYCQPNLEAEGFSIAFIEAFYAGLPIVTSPIGGALEIVDVSCGALVEPGDEEDLARAFGKLISDEELRKRLGEKGRERALERCDPVRQFGELERVFRQIVARHES